MVRRRTWAWLPARRQPVSRRSRQQLLAALGVEFPTPARGSVAFLRRRPLGLDARCPACRVADEETRRWFYFFETETSGDTAVRNRLLAAQGLCAAHTRRLLGQGASASWLCSSMFGLLVTDAAERPLPAPDHSTPPAPCPVCAVVDAVVVDLLELLAGCLDTSGPTADDEVALAYRRGAGLCVPHATRFLAGALPDAVRLVAAQLAERLATTPELAADVVTGDDPDAPARHRLRAAAAPGVLAADAAARGESLDARVAALLSRPCCPTCAARATAQWRILAWLRSGAAVPDDPAAAGDLSDPTAATNPSAAINPPAVTEAGTDPPAGPHQAAGDQASTAVGGPSWDEPDRFGRSGPALVRRGGRPLPRPGRTAAGVRSQLASVCPRHLGDLVADDGAGSWLTAPVATVVRLGAARWREAATNLAADQTRRHPADDPMRAPATCLVCAAGDEAYDRELRLLALLGVDPARVEDVVRSHGPCQRCRPRVVALGPPGQLWDRAAARRTAALAFEFTEAVRQRGWSARWDVPGAELSAWRRAPSRLDGAVLGPPPVEQLPTPAAVPFGG